MYISKKNNKSKKNYFVKTIKNKNLQKGGNNELLLLEKIRNFLYSKLYGSKIELNEYDIRIIFMFMIGKKLMDNNEMVKNDMIYYMNNTQSDITLSNILKYLENRLNLKKNVFYTNVKDYYINKNTFFIKELFNLTCNKKCDFSNLFNNPKYNFNATNIEKTVASLPAKKILNENTNHTYNTVNTVNNNPENIIYTEINNGNSAKNTYEEIENTYGGINKILAIKPENNASNKIHIYQEINKI